MGNCLKPQRAASWADGDEWEEAEVCCKGPAAAAGVEEKKVEVKIRVTRRQLQELLEKAATAGGGGGGKAKARQVEEVLAELMTTGRVCYGRQHDEMRSRQWRPSLYSIPEAAAEEP
ncbi:hypothetical protein U9M48_017466 [Paspalum notatum var. saurae]|uniref:Uncharacterized protein n=1 Tax=Paspalum notatum var. saurae TaxID=547442 RepID=A0AAQ3T8K6_PASNO